MLIHKQRSLMEIQDIATAREECRVCISKWQAEVESLKALIDAAPTYSAAALTQSINARVAFSVEASLPLSRSLTAP
jgi:hypothetical protein